MKIKVIKEYKKLIEVGTEWNVSTERGKVLIDAGVAEEVKENKSTKTANK